MAMTNCKECNAQISTTAASCPQCGASPRKTSGCAVIIAVFLGLAFFSAIMRGCTEGADIAQSPSHGTPSASNIAPTASSASPDTAAPKLPEPTPGSQWSYRHEEDPMGKGVSFYAHLTSTNVVQFDFPYNEPQHAFLTLRTHPRFGKDIILRIKQGQFLCRSYEDCNVLVRFDDKNSLTFAGVGASDGSSNTVFIRNYPRFLSSMVKAKRVRLSTEVYQEGSPVFEFDVSDFNESKYMNKQ
ncbi:MAG: hypothetical protein ACK46K_08790 [Gammaproteobacteria bacterium]